MMFAHVFDMSYDQVFVVIWSDRNRTTKLEEYEFKTRDEAIDWLWDEFTAMQTEWRG